MSLSITVAPLADAKKNDSEAFAVFAKDFKKINKALKASGADAHKEPEEVPAWKRRGAPGSIPYSWLHYLRRAVAHARAKKKTLKPMAKGKDPADDPLVDRELFVDMSSHVICHSDSEGYYVPVDFSEPIYESALPGGILGSSQQLIVELLNAAKLLGIKLIDDGLSSENAKQLASEKDGSHPLWIERQAWFTLYEAARRSCVQNAAIRFG